jgi:prephenate dehydrogenase
MSVYSIKKVSIIGVGFMGGSLALALREKFSHWQIWGYARSKKSAIKLRRLKIVDRVEQDIKKLIEDADIVVLAAPVLAIVDYFDQIAPFLKKGAIVIDLGSTKEAVVKAAGKRLPRKVKFIGCHPLCGSEKSGAQFSRKGLYKGAVCLIASSSTNKSAKVVKALWEKLGSIVIFISPGLHDKILSCVSHLPHVISFSLTYFVPGSYLKFSSASLRDLTRISGSPPGVWADILLSNKANVLRDIKGFIKVLEKFESILTQGDRKKIESVIKSINEKQRLINTGIITEK